MKEKKIIPYKPLPFRDGNKIVKKYTERFEDRVGNTGTYTKVDYYDKKGKLNDGYVLYVKWDEN
jgi:hypothetical protein